MFHQAFKTIVVGVDFSVYSKVVVKQAQLLGRLWKANLVLVHAIESPVSYAAYPYGSIYLPNLEDAKTYESRLRKTYGISDASIKVVAKYASPELLISAVAKKIDRALIMVGYRGNSKMAELVFGSTAQQLAMSSRKPVWIHRGDKVVDPKKILVPHDLSPSSDHSIDVVNKLSLAHPASFEVFHVSQKPFPILDFSKFSKLSNQVETATQEKIQNLFRKYPKVNFKTGSGDVTDEIVKRSKDFDLLVMAHHNKKSLFSKSETATLMKKVSTPLIVAH
jgi:nucleotide-binding universal stress UspA family protein